MIHHCVGITAMGLPFSGIDPIVKEIYFYVWPWIQWLFMTSTSCMDVVITMALVVAWATRGQTRSGCQYTMVCGNIRGTSIVLRIPWDSTNPTKKGLRA